MFRSLGAARSAAVAGDEPRREGLRAGDDGTRRPSCTATRAEEFERVGDTTQAAHAAANLGEVLITSGLLDEAEAVLTDARQTLRASDYLAAIFTETQLARLAIEKGDPHGHRDLTRLVDEARAMGDIGYAFDAVDPSRRCPPPRRQGRARARGAGTRRTLLVDATSPQRASIARERATALMQTGDLSRADDELATALRIARAQGLAYEEALILVVLADSRTPRPRDGGRRRAARGETSHATRRRDWRGRAGARTRLTLVGSCPTPRPGRRRRRCRRGTRSALALRRPRSGSMTRCRMSPRAAARRSSRVSWLGRGRSGNTASA